MSLTTPNLDTPINALKNLLKCKMHAYLAMGSMEDYCPRDANKLYSLYNGENRVFESLGDLQKEPIDINFGGDEEDIHMGKVPGVRRVEVTVKSLSLNQSMIDFLDDNSMEIMTLLFVPFRNPDEDTISATNPVKAVFVTDLMLVPSGNLNGNNKYPGVELKFSTEPVKWGDVVKLLTFIRWTEE